MEKYLHIRKALLIFTVLLFAGSLVSCLEKSETRPRVWIDSPRGGATVPVDSPVVVLSHAYARAGIAEVVLHVNGVAHSRGMPSDPGIDFSEFRHEWTPTGPGDYTLQLWVYDSLGETGNPATIAVHVGGEEIEIPSPTSPPTVTFVDTPTPTNVPTATNPPPRPTDTATSPPPPPQDTTPPPTPSPAVPADGLVVSCRLNQTLAWLPVQDNSGGSVSYYVVLQREITAGNWQNVNSWESVSGKQVDASVDCGGTYRWRVRARDNAGNFSGWSAYSTFAVDLT
jgi:hypothetical protein